MTSTKASSSPAFFVLQTTGNCSDPQSSFLLVSLQCCHIRCLSVTRNNWVSARRMLQEWTGGSWPSSTPYKHSLIPIRPTEIWEYCSCITWVAPQKGCYLTSGCTKNWFYYWPKLISTHISILLFCFLSLRSSLSRHFQSQVEKRAVRVQVLAKFMSVLCGWNVSKVR